MPFANVGERGRGVWSEEEMCEVFSDESGWVGDGLEEAGPDEALAGAPGEPGVEAWVSAQRRHGAWALAGGLRREVTARNLVRAAGHAHELTRGAVPSVIYAAERGGHGNFLEASYRRICADAAWRRRLGKAHTSKRQARPTGVDEEVRAWRELDAASSSDALLMNIFCYPRVLRPALATLLGVPVRARPEFGYKPRVPLCGGAGDASEIDMRLGTLLVESKLTEAHFQHAPIRKLERYRDFAEVFDREMLAEGPRGVEGYQLIRGVLAAFAEGGSYCVLCDARRTDLQEAWFSVARAVRSFQMQARLRLVTWQELSRAVPGPLRSFLAEKYGIVG